MSSLAIAGYLESQFTHSLCTTNLEGRTPRDVSSLSFQDDQCAPRRKHQMELSKADCLGSEFISTSDITRSPKQHAGISVARNCKRNSPCIKSEEHRPVKKTAHNMIEKRYRNKLNDSIAELRDNIPSLRPGGPRMAGEVDPMPKLYKATVITKAVEYISFLEKEISRLMDENEHLRSRIRPAGEKTLPAHSLIQYGQTDCAENES